MVVLIIIVGIGEFIRRVLGIDLYRSEYNPVFKYELFPKSIDSLHEQLRFVLVFWYSRVDTKYLRLAKLHNFIFVFNLIIILVIVFLSFYRNVDIVYLVKY